MNVMKIWFAIIFAVAIAAHCAESKYMPLDLQGQTFTHDPSTILKDGTNYYMFGTGPGIRPKISPDLVHWENLNSVFSTTPA